MLVHVECEHASANFQNVILKTLVQGIKCRNSIIHSTGWQKATPGSSSSTDCRVLSLHYM